MRSRRTSGWLHKFLSTLAVCAATGVLLSVVARGVAAGAQMGQPSVRTLSGTVTDGSHEPIRGAIVELRSEKSNQTTSYLTDVDGHYNFKRMDGNSDYDIRVIYRGHHSPTRSISKFDSHMNKVINFTVETH